MSDRTNKRVNLSVWEIKKLIQASKAMIEGYQEALKQGAELPGLIQLDIENFQALQKKLESKIS